MTTPVSVDRNSLSLALQNFKFEIVMWFAVMTMFQTAIIVSVLALLK